MIRINLVARRIPKVHLLVERQVTLFVVFLVAIVVISLGWRSSVASQIAGIGKEIAKKDAEISQLQNVENVKSEFEKKRQRREDILKTIKKLQARKIGPRPFLEDLNIKLPPDIWLTKISEIDYSITVSGYSFSNPAVADLMREMENSPHFKNVELSGIEKTEVQKEEVKEFTITCKWEIEQADDVEDKDTKETDKKKDKGKKKVKA